MSYLLSGYFQEDEEKERRDGHMVENRREGEMENRREGEMAKRTDREK